jgi:hypothetical protein
LFVAALGSAALAFAGCGGSDDSSSGGGSGSSSGGGASDAKLTKSQYIAKADAICRDNQTKIDPIEKDIDALSKDSQGRADTKAIAPILERALKVTREGFARLKELPEPAEDRATLDRWLTSNEESFDALEKLQAAVAENDRKKAEGPGADVDRLSTEQRTLAKKYGFFSCLSAASTE